MSALTLDRINLRRGKSQILSDVNVRFESGRMTAVIGPNGAGKSSLLQIAAGLLKPTSGTAMMGGQSITQISRRHMAQRRAFLPQRASVEWPITVERTVALGLIPVLPSFGEVPAHLRPAIYQALSACGVLELKDRQATDLSGGELARVMLARATVGDPDLLIVDEPTAGLDPRHALDAVRRLHLRAQAGRTVIVAIHDLDLALNYADDVIAVQNGRILAQGSVASTATEVMLSHLYDLPIRLIRDASGILVRFLLPTEIL